jgi:hypothetical protein
MNCVLANRRKWFQPTPEPDVPDVPSVWANFNLANAKYVGSAQLSAVNTSGATKTIDCRAMSALSDGRILFADYQTNYIYVWGFEDGHPFEVAKFKSACDSRVQTSYNGGVQFGADGKSLYIGTAGTNAVYYRAFSSAYDLATNIGTGTTSLFATTDGIAAYTVAMQFSSDGTQLLYKPSYSESGYGSIYWRKSNLAWPTPTTNTGENREYELKRFVLTDAFDSKIIETTSTVTSLYWNSFCFSPDGLAVVFMIGGNTTDTATTKSKYAVKFVMTEAWNPSTMVYHSKLYLGDDLGLTSIPRCCCVNADGTKMLIFDYKNYKFHEYTLA